MWKLELEEDYFRIYDSKKQIAGYLDPDYGNIFPRENQDKIIENMLKNHDTIHGGFIMLPMVKFGIFDTEQLDISFLQKQIAAAKTRISAWKDFIDDLGNNSHAIIQVSHTDQDMLSITIPIKFSKPTRLEKNELLAEIWPILDHLQKLSLL